MIQYNTELWKSLDTIIFIAPIQTAQKAFANNVHE